MGRAALELGVRELAEAAKVSTNTVTRLERGEELKPRTVDAIRSTLEAAGVIFVEENGGGPGVRLRKQGANAADAPKPAGPATDAVKAMEAAIEDDRSKPKR